MPAEVLQGPDQSRVGSLNVTRASRSLTFSTDLMLVYWPCVTAAVAGSEAYSQLNTTSAAVRGLPSCHFTPLFSFQITHLPAGSSMPFSTEGTSLISRGTKFASASR